MSEVLRPVLDRVRHVTMGGVMSGAVLNTVLNEAGGNKADVMEITRFCVIDIVRRMYSSDQTVAKATMAQFCELMLEADLNPRTPA